MHVNVNLEVSDEVVRLALAQHDCGNAERAVELLLRDCIATLEKPAAAPKSKSQPSKRKR
jgi:hypothetical protein